jgi:hypothetical protein
MGGMLVGLFYSMAMLKPARTEGHRAGSYEKKVALVGYLGTGIFFITTFICFFFAAKPIELTKL